ncbi:type II secretion system protein GspF, partial [Burkholderia sp. SIMBA_013]
AFNHAKQQLPLLTRIMLALSDYVRDWGLATGAVIALAIMLWRYSLRAPAARRAWHARVLRLPLAGRFVLGVNAARFASTLAILCGSGVAL